MKIQVLAENLQKKLSFINHAISSRSQLPILLHFHLEAHGGVVTLSSTDLEIALQTNVPAEIETEGSAIIPAKTFTELISSLTQEKITLEKKDGTLTVVTKHTKSTFQLVTNEEFPKLYEERGEKIASIKTTAMKDDFSSVIFSSSIDTTRPALTGVLIKEEETGFLLVATDGYRLSLKHHATEGTASEEGISMIVPARLFRELLSQKDEGKDVHLYASGDKNQLILEIGDSLVIGRLIEAEYPNYEKIIPIDFSASISFSREELQKAVKICSIFARESANIIKLSLQKDKIIVSSQSPSVGQNTVEVEAVLKGEENEIAFNAKYLVDVLANVERSEMVLEITGPLNPGVFKIKGDESFLHLIMPIRTQA